MEFFVFSRPEAGSPIDRMIRTVATLCESSNFGDAVCCPICNRQLLAPRWLPPCQVELVSWGRRYADVIFLSDELILSDRFTDMCHHHGLRGLRGIEPVEVVRVVHRRGRPQEPLPRYFKATVVYSPTTVDQEASGYVWENESEVCPACLRDSLMCYERLVIKEDTWNGDDIFYARGAYHGPIVTERFRIAFIEHSLIGAVFIPAIDDHYEYFG